MNSVQIKLKDADYEISIGPGQLKNIGKVLKELENSKGKTFYKNCAIVTNTTVEPLYAQTVSESLKNAGFTPTIVVIKDGENYKNLATVETIYHQLANAGLDRHSFIVALGGGVIGDMAGFVAATYLRGINFIQVPTTVMSQVDSSIGGKVGVNLPQGKNLIGNFFQPQHVFTDIATLDTLPVREYRSGFAEVIKHGLIADINFFEYLEKNAPKLLEQDPQTLSDTIAWSCRIKASVVEQDERESNIRAILNYGHTVGHAIETICGYGYYLHGEAVAIGMLSAAHLAVKMGQLTQKQLDRHHEILNAFKLPTKVDKKIKTQEVLDAIGHDKKIKSGKLNFIILENIGRCRIQPFPSVDILEDSVNYILN